MKTIYKVLPAAFAALLVVFAVRAGADVRIEALDETGIILHDDEVIITGRDASEARITPDGALLIRDKIVTVTPQERQLLRQYSQGIHAIEEKGMEVGRQAVGMLGGMVGTLVTDLLNADDDKHMDADMKQKTEPLSQAARALCDQVKSQKALQDAIVAELPAFRPYAVIDTDTEHDCHVDHNED